MNPKILYLITGQKGLGKSGLAERLCGDNVIEFTDVSFNCPIRIYRQQSIAICAVGFTAAYIQDVQKFAEDNDYLIKHIHIVR